MGVVAACHIWHVGRARAAGPERFLLIPGPRLAARNPDDEKNIQLLAVSMVTRFGWLIERGERLLTISLSRVLLWGT